MNDLISQLWICLAIATLLGGLIGWFFRGDKSQKLAEIENRWHKRFSDLEYTNQSLIRKLKDCMKQERNHKMVESRLERMKKGAELSSYELKRKKTRILELETSLDTTPKKKTPYSKLHPSESHKSTLHDKALVITELENEYELLANKVDGYKASLLDAESKLQVAYEMIETQGLSIKKRNKD